MKEIFLGGTCNNSDWRNSIIPLLKCLFFNPVVDNWTEEAQELEKQKRETCDIVLYVITPRMKGVYSIAEVTQDSNIRPEKTIFTILDYDDSCGEELEFDEHQWNSLLQTKELIESNGAKCFDNLIDTVNYINEISL